MSSREIGSKSGKSRKGITQSMKEIPSSKNSKTIIILALILGVSVFGIPLLVNIITGSFIGLPEVENQELHIGYCKFTLYARNSTGQYNLVNGTFEFIDYYNDSKIINTGVFDGTTVYQTTNVTFGYITSVMDSEGLPYPNMTFLIYANKTIATAHDNVIYINPYPKPSEFSVQIFKIGDNYGNFDLGDITDVNFTMSMKLKNNGNGTTSQTYYIPLCHRYNESIWNTGSWLKANVLIDFVVMGDNQQDVYYDGVGNSYFFLPTVYDMGSIDVNLQFSCKSIPTRFDFIEGQWNATILETITN